MRIHAYKKNISDAERLLPLYAVTIGEKEFQNKIHRPAGINDYQLLYTKSGKGAVKIKEEEFEVREGDVFILPPFTPHEYKPKGHHWQTLWITYNGAVAQGSFAFPVDIRHYENFETHYKKISRGVTQNDWRRKTGSVLYELLMCLLEREGLSSIPHTVKAPDVSLAVQYIAEHYHETIEISKLAEITELSEGHFYRVFKQYTHMSPIEYITHLRIERAKDMLIQSPPISIAKIAKSVSYTSAAYFTKTFKNKTGLTPKEYRQSYNQ